MTEKINITYIYKGIDDSEMIFLPEHQGSGFTGDFTEEEPIDLKPVAYFFDDSIAEKTRIALNYKSPDDTEDDDEEEFFTEVYRHDDYFNVEYEDHQQYLDLNIETLKECSFQNDVEKDFESWENVRDVGMQLLWFYHLNNKNKKEEF